MAVPDGTLCIIAMKTRILFLQLPALDNDTENRAENLPLAGMYLEHALRRSAFAGSCESVFLGRGADELDNAGLVRAIVAARPAIVAATLYLWNIERSLRVLARVRRELPAVKVVVGGPEVAPDNPLLRRSAVPHAMAAGEGEAVFPLVVGGLLHDARPDVSSVAWREGGALAWGRKAPRAVSLGECLPPVAAMARIETAGVAYVETTRGCPMRCSFCRYHHLRASVDSLAAEQVGERVAACLARGAREIRFIDPTLNANPDFPRLLRCLAELRKGCEFAIFAEMKGDGITAKTAEQMAAAGFKEVEIGLQSTDEAVLRAIRRPTRVAAVEAGVRNLARCGIGVTLDLMYGLPLQTREDVWRSLDWGLALEGVRLQCMQTLLLPGTDLRRHAARWRMTAAARPPYGVTQTGTLDREDILRIEQRLLETPELPCDCPTPRLVGKRLSGLFPDRVEIAADAAAWRLRGQGGTRRAVVFRGPGLFRHRSRIAGAIRRAVRAEPDVLWQFVLALEQEEPLDLLDALVAELRASPGHVLDRYAATRLTRTMSARRLFVLLERGRDYDREWVDAADRALRAAFR
jgi:hypothetical protein